MAPGGDGRTIPRVAEAVLLYDHDCGFCRICRRGARLGPAPGPAPDRPAGPGVDLLLAGVRDEANGVLAPGVGRRQRDLGRGMPSRR